MTFNRHGFAVLLLFSVQALSSRSLSANASSTAATTIFHELAHAEWDLYVEEGETAADRELLTAFNELLPALNAGYFQRRILPSEIFAYYRVDLLKLIESKPNLRKKVRDCAEPRT
ncbi:MAG: hypothetical protein J0L82_10615 [Deltaproteobacteria bacterium]|nr:hypothetical protein [Deltaproteobacteria bacterium]